MLLNKYQNKYVSGDVAPAMLCINSIKYVNRNLIMLTSFQSLSFQGSLAFIQRLGYIVPSSKMVNSNSIRPAVPVCDS